METFGRFTSYRVHPTYNPRPFKLSLSERRFLFLALGVLLASRLLLVFWLPFTDTTEARYAEIARKMIETGDWITPQFDYGIPFWGKPPLHTWVSAICMEIFGVGGFGARVGILLSALAVLGLTGSFMARHVGPDPALVAMIVLFSSLLFFGASAFVMTDMVMVLGTTLSMVAFYACVSTPSQSGKWGHLFFLGISIGLLAKGPVALVLCLIPITLWVTVGRRWSSLASLPWLSGSALLLVLTLPWYIAAELKTPGFLSYFFVGEHFERFVVSGWQGDLYGSGHARPKGTIWFYGLGAFLPWTFFAGWLVLRGKQVVNVVREDGDGLHTYLLCWALAPMLLFSPAANILSAYALPAMPACALLLVSLWARVKGAPHRVCKRLFILGVASTTSVFLAVAAALVVAPEKLNLKSQRALVAQALQTDPDIQLTYWGGRSYSAEFYTNGKARATHDPNHLQSLGLNTVRDAVAVSAPALEEVETILGDRFVNQGKFGRTFLWVEVDEQGAKP